MEYLKSLIDAINLLLQEGAALSVLLGLVVAIGGTQYVKRLEAFPSKKWAIRGLALPLGFLATFFTWPIHQVSAVRIFVALSVGLISPFVYTSFVSLVAIKWPNFAAKMSANPDEATKTDS